MAKSIFRDKIIIPDSQLIEQALMDTKLLWDDLIDYVLNSYPNTTSEWKYYGVAWGWSFVLKSKTKTLCYLTPNNEYFHVSIIFNDKGRLLTQQSNLPEQIMDAVELSKNNAKNIPYDFDLRQENDIDIAKKLIAIRAKA